MHNLYLTNTPIVKQCILKQALLKLFTIEQLGRSKELSTPSQGYPHNAADTSEGHVVCSVCAHLLYLFMMNRLAQTPALVHSLHLKPYIAVEHK